MRLAIDHRTTYRFSRPQARIVQMLRMTPSDTDDQTIAAWRIDVDCDARLREGRDGFGNRITMLYADGPISTIEIAVAGQVLTGEYDGMVRGGFETLPPALYARSTETTLPDDAITAFARGCDAGAPHATLVGLADGLQRRFALDRARPEPGLSAAAAFGRKAATPRDLAHMLAAAVRALGIPARYVSGHCLTGSDDSDHATAHAWVEGYIDGVGWLGIDPCFARIVDERYVRVAHGLDAVQAAPVAGSRLGTGNEWLAVDVHVARLNGEDNAQ